MFYLTPQIEPRRIAKVVVLDIGDPANPIQDTDRWKVLLLRRIERDRRPESIQGLDLPGGNVRRSESYEHGAIRETREETQLRLKKETLFFLKSQAFSSGYGYIHWFVAPYSGGDVVLEPKEHEEYFWLEIGQLKKVEPYPPNWMMRLIREGVKTLESERFN
jgi:8-oxo-dGTP pyrophosphatase MutT (NUDIX family)